MDQIIPILIAAVVFGFQAYANYQKEQQKAKKRNFGKPDTDEFKEFEEHGDYGDVVIVEEPASRPVTPPQPGRQPDKPVYQAQEPRPSLYSRYQGAIDSVEVRRARKRQKEAVIDVQLTDLDERYDTGSAAAQGHFDLRQAVIQAAILERPYKD